MECRLVKHFSTILYTCISISLIKRKKKVYSKIFQCTLPLQNNYSITHFIKLTK